MKFKVRGFDIVKKKVMLLISNLNIGGTEKALINMLNVMEEKDFNVDVYVLEKKVDFYLNFQIG